MVRLVGPDRTTRAHQPVQLILGDQWSDFGNVPHLVPQRFRIASGQPLATAAAHLGNGGNNLGTLFDGNQRSFVLGMARLTTLFLAAAFLLRRWLGMRMLRAGRQGRIAWRLVQTCFEFRNARIEFGNPRQYADARGGTFDEANLTAEDDGCLVVSEGLGGVTALYPYEFMDWDDASQHLSKQLQESVFSFHIHDSDLWMYLLYDKGALVDQFNPIPGYWQKLSDDERSSWRGNVSEVVKRVPGLKPTDIANYLVEWRAENRESIPRKRAYPSDRFYYGDDWQLLDFMAKLELEYPIDDRGAPHGTTYRFKPAARR
jgi:hypothetical protein